MADLTGEVEDDLTIANQNLHGCPVADVGDVHAHPILDAGKVEHVAAGLRNHRVDDEHVRSEIHERPDQIAADEAQASGDEDAFTSIEIAMGVRHGRSLEAPPTGTAGSG